MQAFSVERRISPEAKKDILVDLHGSWGRSSGKSGFYQRMNSGGYRRVDVDGTLPSGVDFDVKIRKLNYTHPVAKELRKTMANVFLRTFLKFIFYSIVV